MISPIKLYLALVLHKPKLNNHKQFHSLPASLTHLVLIVCTSHTLGIQLQAHDKASIHQKELKNQMQALYPQRYHESK